MFIGLWTRWIGVNKPGRGVEREKINTKVIIG